MSAAAHVVCEKGSREEEKNNIRCGDWEKRQVGDYGIGINSRDQLRVSKTKQCKGREKGKARARHG